LKTPSTLEELIAALRCLPGVGPKSAQRMAYHLLQRDKPGAHRLASALSLALERIRHCEKCNSYAEEPVCELCRSTRRDASLLCVVETPGDLLMMEQAQCYDGLYFVLMGALSPLDGIGPREIHLDRLVKRTTPSKARRPRITSASSCVRKASRRAVSRAVFRSAASSSTWTAERWRRP